MSDSLTMHRSALRTISNDREALTASERAKLFLLLGACFISDAALLVVVTRALG